MEDLSEKPGVKKVNKYRYQYGCTFSGPSFNELKRNYDDYCTWCQNTLNTIPTFNSWCFQMILNGHNAWKKKNTRE